MQIETMIYIYSSICASMIVFNIIYNLRLKRSDARTQARCKKIKAQMEPQLAKLQQGEPLDEAHQKYLQRQLKKVNWLIAFDQTLDDLLLSQPELGTQYLRQIQPSVLYLALVYQKRENTQSGYFAYLLSKHMAKWLDPTDSLQNVLLAYVKKENLYCRINALRALFHFANIEYIITAIKLQDDGSIFLHEKILTELLLSFSGDHHRLIAQLWQEWRCFSLHTQLSILNYVRFQSGDYQEDMFAMMQYVRANKELRLAAIRYLGKYPYAPALEPLIAFVQERDPGRWEYATVAASALSGYPAEQVTAPLKQALYSENWYIRSAAAQSLERLNVDFSALVDVVIGSDRYAREIMTYHLESRMLQHGEVTAK